MYTPVVPLHQGSASASRGSLSDSFKGTVLEQRLKDMMKCLHQSLLADFKTLLRQELKSFNSVQEASDIQTNGSQMHVAKSCTFDSLENVENEILGSCSFKIHRDSWESPPTQSTNDGKTDQNEKASLLSPANVRESSKQSTNSKRSFCNWIEDNEDEVGTLFHLIDIDNSKDVSKSEFLRAFKTDDSVVAFCSKHANLAPLLHPKTFRSAFQMMDNNDGKTVSLSELRSAVERLQTMTANDVEVGRSTIDFTLERGGFEVSCAHHGKLDERVYDVADFYKNVGVPQAIARSDLFQNVTLAVIVLNALYIGADAEYNTEDVLMEAAWPFIVGEFSFFVFFIFEWLVRYGAFEKKWDCLKDFWFKFDSLLCVLMVFETLLMPVITALLSSGTTPPTGPLRLLRLLRLTRLVRLMRSLPELLTIIKGMRAGMRAVTSSLLLVGVQVYIFGIIIHALLSGEDFLSEYFSTLPRCMWTLVLDGTLLDNTGDVLDMLVYRGQLNTSISVLVFLMFILVTAITLMNMLIGVLCEVVSSVAADEREESAIRLMKKTVLVELQKFDDGDQNITEYELNELMSDPNAVCVLEALGIDVPFLQEWQVMLFDNPDMTIPINDIMEQMLACREDLPVMMKHLIIQFNLTKWWMTHKILQHEKRMERKLDSCCYRLVEELRPRT